MSDDVQGTDDEQQRSRRRRFIAATAVTATGGAWAVPRVAAAQTAPGAVSAPPVTTTTTEPPPPPPATCDLTKWVKPRTAGNWDVADDGQSVVQTQNGNVTFFVSPEVLDAVTFDFLLEVETSGDDDLIGFAVGYNSPIVAADTDHDHVLLSWKQNNQDVSLEGSVLARVSGVLAESGSATPFWKHSVDAPPEWNVLASDISTTSGWADNTQYAFRVVYQTGPAGNIKIFRKPTDDNVFPLIGPGDLLFDVDGAFSPGRIAFYNYSQGSVRYIFANC